MRGTNPNRVSDTFLTLTVLEMVCTAIYSFLTIALDQNQLLPKCSELKNSILYPLHITLSEIGMATAGIALGFALLTVHLATRKEN